MVSEMSMGAERVGGDVIMKEYLLKRESMEEGTEETPIIKLLNSFLTEGIKANASDIHIEPRAERLVIRMRTDGQLMECVELEKKLHPALIARTKIMAGMDIAEKRLPQDGHFKMVFQGREMHIRTSTIPTVYGEKAVLRFLNAGAEIDFAKTFGMNPENFEKVQEILRHPYGIMYITGPTGSGKTTTLYMILESLASNPVNIVTIEEPVERNIDGVNQIQVNRPAGLTFESGLRAILRQDPDIIMVGETRDSQTAMVSVRAAITGHLVLSTLHTNDAVGAIMRLVDMGVEPFLVADSLSGIVAQRLVRKICPYCKMEIPASEEDCMILEADIKKLWRGKGCHRCKGTGYRGRMAVHEVVVIDKNIRRMIARNRPEEEIYDYVEHVQKMTTLKKHVLRLVKEGVTTVEEFVRVADRK